MSRNRFWFVFSRHRGNNFIDLKTCWVLRGKNMTQFTILLSWASFFITGHTVVITLHVVLCGPLYIRFWSLRAFGNIMCSHYCRLHKTQAGNELLSTFPLAWHIVLVIEFKDVKDLSYLKGEEVHLFIKNNAPENKWYAVLVDWWHEIKANCRTL